jgi:hypothetical protein
MQAESSGMVSDKMSAADRSRVTAAEKVQLLALQELIRRRIEGDYQSPVSDQ